MCDPNPRFARVSLLYVFKLEHHIELLLQIVWKHNFWDIWNTTFRTKKSFIEKYFFSKFPKTFFENLIWEKKWRKCLRYNSVFGNLEKIFFDETFFVRKVVFQISQKSCFQIIWSNNSIWCSSLKKKTRETTRFGSHIKENAPIRLVFMLEPWTLILWMVGHSDIHKWGDVPHKPRYRPIGTVNFKML